MLCQYVITNSSINKTQVLIEVELETIGCLKRIECERKLMKVEYGPKRVKKWFVLRRA